MLSLLPLSPTGQPLDVPLSPYDTVVPLLARQFSQLQVLGSRYDPGPLTPGMVANAPVSTPLSISAWQQALALHPNQEWVQHLVAGLQDGFRIGLLPHPVCHSALGISPSALNNQEAVAKFIGTQISAGHMVGPLPPHECANVITSRLAVIPKKTPGQFRVIVDLSSPSNFSVNDNLHRNLTHVAYSSVDEAAAIMHNLGRHTLMAKLDIKDAYRLIPVHPQDRRFLGISWQGAVYVDCQLPFGLASAPAIFSAVAQALEWILRARGVSHMIHYLDDFLVLGAPNSPECADALAITLHTCAELGVPLAADKIEGPTTSLTFLGIQLDSTSLSLSLPGDRLGELRGMLDRWVGRKCINEPKQFQSLVGHLVHATQVVPLGKAFLANLFPLAQTLKPGQYRRINAPSRSDLAWWQTLCTSWSGVSAQQLLLLNDPAHHLFTDASGSWGCGAWSLPNWFQIPWQGNLNAASIAIKELFPIVVACAIWGHLWHRQYILCHSDNTAAVAYVNKLYAKDPLATHLIRCLAYFQALFDFRIRAVHISGHLNVGADDLSRDRAAAFLRAHPSASPLSTQVSQEVLNLLLQKGPDWTSQEWKRLCSNFWKQV